MVHIAIDCIVCVLMVLCHDRFASSMEDSSPLMCWLGSQRYGLNDYTCAQRRAAPFLVFSSVGTSFRDGRLLSPCSSEELSRLKDTSVYGVPDDNSASLEADGF